MLGTPPLDMTYAVRNPQRHDLQDTVSNEGFAIDHSAWGRELSRDEGEDACNIVAFAGQLQADQPHRPCEADILRFASLMCWL